MPLRTGVPLLEEAAAACWDLRIAAGSGGTGLSRTERGVLVRTEGMGVVGFDMGGEG